MKKYILISIIFTALLACSTDNCYECDVEIAKADKESDRLAKIANESKDPNDARIFLEFSAIKYKNIKNHCASQIEKRIKSKN